MAYSLHLEVTTLLVTTAISYEITSAKHRQCSAELPEVITLSRRTYLLVPQRTVSPQYDDTSGCEPLEGKHGFEQAPLAHQQRRGRCLYQYSEVPTQYANHVLPIATRRALTTILFTYAINHPQLR